MKSYARPLAPACGLGVALGNPPAEIRPAEAAAGGFEEGYVR